MLLNKWCKTQQTTLRAHCRVLPPGELNSMILVPSSIYPNSCITTAAVIVFPYCCYSNKHRIVAMVTNIYQRNIVNPLDSKDNYSATSNNTKMVHWPLMGGLLHLLQGLRRAAAPPSPLLAVPNVTTHPSTASVPITVLLWSVAQRF